MAARPATALLMLLMLPGIPQRAAAQAPTALPPAAMQDVATPAAFPATAAPAAVASAPAPAPALESPGTAPEQEASMPVFEVGPAATTGAGTPVLTDAVIRQAVRDIIAEDPRLPPAPGKSAAYSGGATQARLSAAFDQARVPDCFHDDALKHQPATLGPFAVSGPYVLPWLLSAALRGKCR